MKPRSDLHDELMGEVTGEIEAVFEAVARLGGELRKVLDEGMNLRGAATREDLVALRPAITRLLERHRSLAKGAGMIFTPGVLADAPRWIEWWWWRTSAAPEALRINLDPEAPDHYDYLLAEWYRVPVSTGERHVTGPYVDYACTNEYAVTLSLPVEVEDRVVAVAGADLVVSGLEERLVPLMCRMGQPLALINAEGRVVLSSSSDWMPGMLHPEAAAMRSEIEAACACAAPLPWLPVEL